MSVAIKIEEKKKEKVQRFLATFLLQENIKVPMQEAIGLMIDYALENEDNFLKKLKKQPPLEDDPIWKILQNPKQWGIKDSSKRIDDSIYGC